MYLALPDCKTVSFEKLVKNASQNNQCPKCNSDLLSTLNIRRTGKYIILMLQRCTAVGTKLETQITHFQTEQILVSGKTYSCIANIFHEGVNVTSGHYAIYLKNTTGWTEGNDRNFPFKQRLPNKLPNSYLLFLEPKLLEPK